MSEPDTTSSELHEEASQDVEDAQGQASTESAVFDEELSGVVESQASERKDDFAEADASGDVISDEPTNPAAALAEEEAAATPERRIEQLLDQLDAPSQAGERAAVLREVANIYEQHLDEPEHGFIAWVQSLAEDPGNDDAYEGAARLATGQQQWLEAVASFNETLATLAEQPALAADMYTLLGRCYGEQLNRADLAAPCFAQALQLNPGHEGALEAGTRLYRDTHSWEALVGNLLHATSLTQDAERLQTLRLEAANTLWTQLGDAGRAAPLFLQLLQDNPEHAEASDNLEQLYRANDAHQELCDLLQERALGQSGDELGDTRLALGALYSGPLADADRAAECYQAALEASPANPEALTAVADILRTRGDWARLLEVLDTRIKLAETPKEQCDLHAQRAVLYEEEIGDFTRAASCYRQVVDLDPGRETAYVALARLYRRSQSFEELAETLDHHAKSLDDEDKKAELLLAAARVLIGDLGDTERASHMCDRVLGLTPDMPEALKLAARLRTATGDRASAVDALDVLADAEMDVARRAERLIEAARLLEETGEKQDAIDRYRAALEAVPSLPEAVQALRRLYPETEQYAALVDLLQEEADTTQDAELRASLLLELAELRREHLNESAQAAEVYRASLELSPDNAAAALALGDIAYDDGDLEQAVTYLEPLLDKTAQLDPEQALRAALRTGAALRDLERYERAENAFAKALSMQADDPTALLAMGELAQRAERGAEAATHFRKLLATTREELDAASVGGLLLRLGAALELDDQYAEAAEVFGEAADLTPTDLAPLQALGRSQRAIEDWEGLLKTLRRQLGALEGAERVPLLLEMGQVLADKQDRADKAIECFQSALELQPDSRNALARLMALYSAQQAWPELVDTLQKLANVGDEGELSAKYLYTAGAMASERLQDHARAAELFAEVLAVQPNHPRAFDGQLDALRASEQWAPLADGLAEKLDRLGEEADPALRAPLLDELASLRLDHLDDADGGLEALQQAQGLAPDAERNLRLLHLYREKPTEHAKPLVRTCQTALRHNPSEVDAYRALRTLYTEGEEPDAVWCVCQALKSLDMANEEETAFFRRHRTLHAAEAKACIEPEAWDKWLRHRDEDPLLTAIFASVAPAALSLYAKPPAEVGLRAEYLSDPTTDPRLLARMLHYASGVAMLPMPHLYFLPQSQAGVEYLPTMPPVLAMGQGATQEAPDQAVAFIAGRQIAYLHNGYFMRQLESSGRGLRAWLLAAIRRSVQAFPVPEELSTVVERNGQALSDYLDDEQKAGLEALVQRLLDAAPELDMKRWARAVDLTADRVGLALANNLAACVAVIEASGDEQAMTPKQERLGQLHGYAVSPQYFGLRRHLGLTLS